MKRFWDYFSIIPQDIQFTVVMEEIVIFPPWALTCIGDLMVSRAIQFTRDPSTLTHTYTLSNITTPNLAILSHCVIWTFCKMRWVASRPLSRMTVTARNSFAEPHTHQQGPLDPLKGKPRPPSCHLPRQIWTALAGCYPGRTKKLFICHPGR